MTRNPLIAGALALRAFAALLVLLFALPASAQPLLLDAGTVERGSASLIGHFWAFHDPSGELTLEQVAAPDYAARFQRMPGPFNAGFSRGAWWLRAELDVAADTTAGWWLQLNTGRTEQVDVWLPGTQGGDWQHYRLGRLQPFTEQDLRVPYAPVHLDRLPAGPTAIWLRLSGRHTLTLAGELRTETAAIRGLIGSTNARTAVFTVVTMLFVVALAIGLAQRDGHFLAFASHLAVMALASLPDTPFVALLPDFAGTARLYDILSSVGLITAVFMAYRFLEIRDEYPRLVVIFLGLMGIGLLLASIAALGHGGFSWWVTRGFSLLANALFLVVAIVRLVQRAPLAIWPFIAYFAGGGGAILFDLHALGAGIPDAWLSLSRQSPIIFAIAVVTGMGQRTLRAERAAREAQARAMADSLVANSDPLTGLPNRRALERHFTMLHEASMRDGRPLFLAVLDIDHFKRLNDHLGHAAGDAVLVQLARMLEAWARRPLDYAARIGGEEFVLLLHDCGAGDGLHRLEELCRNVEAAGLENPDAPSGVVTVSMGGAVRTGSEPLIELTRRADQALYRAKRSGRNRVIVDEAEGSA